MSTNLTDLPDHPHRLFDVLLIIFVIGFAVVTTDNYKLRAQLEVYQTKEQAFKTSMDDPRTRKIMCTKGVKGK